MKRNLNWKKVWKYSVIFWGVIFVVSLIPIILLSTYNFPCADDLGYSIYTRHAWVDTHNLFAVLGAAGRKVAESYQIWQGTWASIFLMALQPGILGDGTYWIGTLMLLAALIFSVYYFMKVFWGKWLGSSKTQRFIVTFLFLFFGIQFLIDKTQGLFWYNGACHYIFPWSALLALAGIVVSMTVDSRHGKRKSIIGILLAIYIGGGNLVTGLECGIWLALNFIDCIMP
jgi:Zn-dependent protease with chaperone function